MNKQNPRLRRAKRSRFKMAELNAVRLTVYRSNGNIYAQIIEGNSNKVLASASTLETELKKKLKKTSNIEAASEVGKRIAEKAIKVGVKEVAFDRSGYKYHGKVKALAEAIRENGVKI